MPPWSHAENRLLAVAPGNAVPDGLPREAEVVPLPGSAWAQNTLGAMVGSIAASGVEAAQQATRQVRERGIRSGVQSYAAVQGVVDQRDRVAPGAKRNLNLGPTPAEAEQITEAQVQIATRWLSHQTGRFEAKERQPGNDWGTVGIDVGSPRPVQQREGTAPLPWVLELDVTYSHERSPEIRKTAKVRLDRSDLARIGRDLINGAALPDTTAENYAELVTASIDRTPMTTCEVIRRRIENDVLRPDYGTDMHFYVEPPAAR